MMPSEHEIYLEDQRTDTLTGAGVDEKYLDYLFEDLAHLHSLDRADIEVLDVGVGRFLSFWYFDQYLNHQVIGVDVAKAVLDYCAENYLPVVDVDAHEMDQRFPPNSRDLIIAFHSLEHMIDIPRVLGHCHTILRPGGILYWAVPIPCPNLKKGHWYEITSVEHMNQMVRDAGMEVLYSEFAVQKWRTAEEMVGVARK